MGTKFAADDKNAIMNDLKEMVQPFMMTGGSKCRFAFSASDGVVRNASVIHRLAI